MSKNKIKQYLRKLIINRKNHLKGDYTKHPLHEELIAADHTPLSFEGARCCLGHAYKALGFTDEELKFNTVFPPSLGCSSRKYKLYNQFDSDFCDKAANINDDDALKRAERERLLIEHFASASPPIELTFVGRNHQGNSQ